MPIKVRIPTPLQKLTNNLSEVTGEGGTVGAVLDSLEGQFAGLKSRLYDDGGQLRRFINFYVNDEDIRFLDGDKTAIKAGDEISIVPAIAGGTSAVGTCGERRL